MEMQLATRYYGLMASAFSAQVGIRARVAAISLLGIFAGLSASHAQTQIGKAPPLVAAPGKVQQAPPPSINYGPMDFYVATGPAGACGPDCSEWIAADGRFDLGAGKRFKEFLNSPRRRYLPVFFESQGGFLSDGIEVAQALREYQMTAGVGRTTPNGCTTQRLPGGTCDQLVKSGKDVPSKIMFTGAQCHSACVFALAGATQRKIALGVLIGVHSPRSDEILWKQYVDTHPGATRMSPEARHLSLWRMISAWGLIRNW